MRKISVTVILVGLFLSGCASTTSNVTSGKQKSYQDIAIYTHDVQQEYEVLGEVSVKAVNPLFGSPIDALNTLLCKRAYAKYKDAEAVIKVKYDNITVAEGILDLSIFRRAKGIVVSFGEEQEQGIYPGHNLSQEENKNTGDVVPKSSDAVSKDDVKSSNDLFNFNKDKEGWQPINSNISVTKENKNVKEGRGALEWRYKVQPQQYSAVVKGNLNAQFSDDEKGVSLWLKSDKPGTIIIQFTENDGSNYQYINSNKPIGEKWQKIQLSFNELTLDADTPDENERLDVAQINEMWLVDAAGYYGGVVGPRTVWIDDIRIIEKSSLDSLAQATQGHIKTTPLVQDWIRNSNNPVVKVKTGTIRHISDPCVIYDNGMYRMWFGCVGADTSYASIGYAESENGASWSVTPNPIFKPNTKGSWDEKTVEIPSVVRDETEADPQKRYKMWYGGSDSKNPNLTKIGYAYSPDGLSWTRLPADESPYGQTGLVIVPGNKSPGDYAVVAEPSVLLRDGVFHNWYSSWDGEALVISYAFSKDGIHWTKHKNNPVLRHTPGSWESGGLGLDGTVAQPTVLWNPASALYIMWYGAFDNRGKLTYSGLGCATSKDGVTWQKLDEPVLIANNSKGEETGIGTGPFVLYHSNVYHMWYGSVDSGFNRVINYATMDASTQ